MLVYQYSRNIINVYIRVPSIIKWRTISHFAQLIQHFTFRHNTTASGTDIPLGLRIILTDNTFPYIVGAIHTSRHPDYQDILPINLFNRRSRQIVWIDFVIITNHIL